MLFSRGFAILAFITTVQGFCGDSIRWSHNFDMKDVYGMWYGVGYAQHTPDMTNKPKKVGCVVLHISDVTTEPQDTLLDLSIIRKNYSDESWRSYRNNPWSDTPLAGSWLDIKLNRNVKRDIYTERRVRVFWDEIGHSMEQTYTYSTDEPGLWVAEKQPFIEKKFNIWFPDHTPRHPQVIRVLKVKPNMLIINHCSEIGDGGIFSLILRRSPSKMKRWEWHDIKKQFYSFELPNTYRYTAVCASCGLSSSLFLQIGVLLNIFHNSRCY